MLMLATALIAQEGERDGLVKYSPDFEFRDGIFANFDMVKANLPTSAGQDRYRCGHVRQGVL